MLYYSYFQQNQLLHLDQFYRNTTFIRPTKSKSKSETNFYQTQKDRHQDNLSFVCLHFLHHLPAHLSHESYKKLYHRMFLF